MASALLPPPEAKIAMCDVFVVPKGNGDNSRKESKRMTAYTNAMLKIPSSMINFQNMLSHEKSFFISARISR